MIDLQKQQLANAQKAQDILFQDYGDPRNEAAYQSKWCVLWEVSKYHSWFPARRILINKVFKVKVDLFFRLLYQRGLWKEIKQFCGCFDARKSRTTSLLSLHYWACAIDLNCNTERLGSKITHWTPEFIQCIKDAGLYWGGLFLHTRDNMHIALLDG